MGKVAGHLKKTAYMLRKMAGKGLQLAGTGAQVLGTASALVGGLHPLVKPELYVGKEVGNWIVKGISSFIPGGGLVSLGADIAKKIADDELQAQVTDREFGGIGWGAVGTGIKALGKFIEPKDSIITFEKLTFDKYQIDKVEDFDRLYLFNTNKPDTCMLSYLKGPIWKCSMSNSSTKKTTTITIPNKGDMLFKFSFDLIRCSPGKDCVNCEDMQSRKFVIRFKRQPKSAEVMSGMMIKVTF